MTSKHLFFKIMHEDMRHRTWMIALSSLGSFLLLPVAWLMNYTNMNDHSSTQAMQRTLDFFSGYYVCGAGAFIAITVALVVGLFGFRFIYRKNMIDTYHSIPVKRRTLYGAYYLNGFLIWFVPFTLGLLVSLIMAGSTVFRNFGSFGSMEFTLLLQGMGRVYLILIVIFLLVYHLVLTSVMLSGNILNTLVSMTVLGVGAVSIFGLCLAYCSLYFSTFCSTYVRLDWPVYGSPLVSALALVWVWMNNTDVLSYAGLRIPLLVNTIVMILLGFAAFYLYERRASELAEQGIQNKVLNPLMKFVVSVAAGLGGWLIFSVITDYAHSGPAWGIFGGALFGVLSFGVMDIVFSMDFKAFFAHKLQMVITVAATLIISLAFYGDWFGYDHYLPDREDVAELAIYSYEYNNHNYWSENFMLSSVHLRDTDAVYAFLERMTGRGIGLNGGIGFLNAGERQELQEIMGGAGERIVVRVTLQNGRSYYRNYYMTTEDKDVVWPLFTSVEYIEKSYLLPEEQLIACDYVTFERSNQELQVEMPLDDVKELLRAYNQDVIQDPDTMLTGQGRLLVSICMRWLSFDPVESGRTSSETHTLDIYDTMEHSIEALTRMHYGEMVTDFKAEDIEEIVLRFGTNLDRVSTRPVNTASEAMDEIREYFGLERLQPVAVHEESDAIVMLQDIAVLGDLEEGGSHREYATTVDILEAPVTDPEEIRELVPLLSYATADSYRGIFQTDFLSVTVTDKEGKTYWCFLRPGMLPEKYISKFEPQVEALFETQQ